MASAGAVSTCLACPPGGDRVTYQPRAAEQSVLYTVVRDHLESFLRAVA